MLAEGCSSCPCGHYTSKAVDDLCWCGHASVSHGKRVYAPLVPEDVWMHVFSFVPLASLASCLRVCQQWHAIANDAHVWKGKCKKLDPRAEATCGAWRELCYVLAKGSVDVNVMLMSGTDGGRSVLGGRLCRHFGADNERLWESRRQLAEHEEDIYRSVFDGFNVAQNITMGDRTLWLYRCPNGSEEATTIARMDIVLLVLDVSSHSISRDSINLLLSHRLLVDVVVVLNKLDTVDWDKGRCDACLANVLSDLEPLGQVPKVVALSALNDQNIATRHPAAWTPSLVDVLEQCRVRTPAFGPPIVCLETALEDIKLPFGQTSLGRCTLRVLQGVLRPGECLISPSHTQGDGELFTVKSMTHSSRGQMTEACGGTVISCALERKYTPSVWRMRLGTVLCAVEHQNVRATTTLTAHLTASPEKDTLITAGLACMVHVGPSCVAGEIVALKSRKKKRFALKGEPFKARIVLSAPVPACTWAQCRRLGHVVIRHRRSMTTGESVAWGRISGLGKRGVAPAQAEGR